MKTNFIKSHYFVDNDPSTNGHDGIIGQVVRYQDQCYIKTGICPHEWELVIEADNSEYEFKVYMKNNYPLLRLDSVTAGFYREFFINGFDKGRMA